MTVGITGATGDCNTCTWWARRGSKKGTKIKGGIGKCKRPQGSCGPWTFRRIVRPQGERQ